MLSSLRPYDYWVEDGQYHFKTPSGATYVAYFLKLPFADNLYTFNFDRLDPGVDGMVDEGDRSQWYFFLLDLAEIWCGCSWRYNFACGNSVTTLPQVLLKEK